MNTIYSKPFGGVDPDASHKLAAYYRTIKLHDGDLGNAVAVLFEDCGLKTKEDAIIACAAILSYFLEVKEDDIHKVNPHCHQAIELQSIVGMFCYSAIEEMFPETIDAGTPDMPDWMAD